MSDAHESGSARDVVKAAEEYHDRLVAEIARVDAFIETASMFEPDAYEAIPPLVLVDMSVSGALH